jgi:hypothetical protein
MTSERFNKEHRVFYRGDKLEESCYAWVLYDREKQCAIEFCGEVCGIPKDYHRGAKLLTYGRYAGMYFIPYGIEKHYKTPQNEYQKEADYEPIDCNILCGKCYTDGSNLDAFRFVHDYGWSGTDEEVFMYLMRWIEREI